MCIFYADSPSSSPRVKSNSMKSSANDSVEATANYMNQGNTDTPTSRYADDERKKRRSRQRNNKKTMGVIRAEAINSTSTGGEDFLNELSV